MKLIVLDATTKTIRAALVGAVATSNPDYVIAYADSTDSTFAEASTDGQLNGTTDVTLVAAPASGVKRTIKSISVYNRDTAPVIVVIKLDVSGTQRILQRVQLVSGETWHSDDLSKLGPGGSDTQVQFNDTGTLAGSSNFTYNKTTSVLTLGANPILTAGTANGVLYLNGSKSATTGSVLTFDGAQLGVNGLTLGRGAGAVATNTAVGSSALAANTTGAFNTAVGNQAAAAMTTGTRSVALGHGALSLNTTGDRNHALGLGTLAANTTGNYNTAVGYSALASSNSDSNVAVGYAAAANTTSGTSIVAVGYAALQFNTTASENTAVGYQAAYSNTTGTALVAVGYQALQNSTGNYNTAVGWLSLKANTTGTLNTGLGGVTLYQNTTGGYNTGVGYEALRNNTTASYNTAVGYQAGYNNTTGDLNTAIGRLALYTNSTGISNSALGSGAMSNNTTGGYNVGIGRDALGSNTTGSNNVVLGTAALYSNTTAFNNTAVGYQAGYSNTTGAESVYIGQNAGYSATTNGQNTFVGRYAGYSTTGGYNCFIGYGAGNAITSGTKNTILGRYDGNYGSLDIRTSNNYIVLSDGDGNPRGYWNASGDHVGVNASSGAFQSSVGTSGGGYYYAYQRVYPSSPVASTTVDSFRFASIQTGAVGGNSLIIGRFYVYAQQTGGNSFTGTYDIQSHGNGTASATLTTIATSTRGTSPVSSVQITNDGAAGAIKLTITYNAFAAGGQPQASVFFDGIIA